MKVSKNKNLWDISQRPHTKAKLRMLRDIFNIWLTIWNAPRQQKWIAKEWYVVDLFAGKGSYTGEKKEILGSPLVFLKEILSKRDKLKENNVNVKLFFVEKNKNYFDELQKRLSSFKKNNPEIKDIVKLNTFYGDCNKKSKEIIKKIINNTKNPLFLFIDPYGINIYKSTIKKYLELNNPIDIFLNYSKEGVTRTRGLVKKSSSSLKGVKTVNSLKDFFGEDVDYKTKKTLELLREYIESLFVRSGYNVVGFDMKYPTRKDVIYYLLFASRNNSITNKIVRSIYAKYKEKISGLTLFGRDFYLNSILSISPKLRFKPRNSLLYKTKVEYGDWTINHIIGCMHGCDFPCYAMKMAQRFGWIKNDEDWRKPKLVLNALELLEEEIPKYKNEIKHFVHLCFMTDPFMYDFEEKDLIPEIKEMTLKIIEKLNKAEIRVTTLTKGFYPDEILDKKRFLQTNEYGITLVSLNEEFKKAYEPFSAPYKKRIESLEKLAKAGLKTWVSMEPYPTPKLPKLEETGAENIEEILERIGFVQKIIFGKLNYSRLNYYNGNYSQTWKNSNDFYKEVAKRVINFCEKNNIKYHIKFGTPLTSRSTIDIFKG